MESQFTAVFQKTDKWWIAFVEELPGANAQGETIDEARENLKEAVELILNKDEMLTEEDMKDILKFLKPWLKERRGIITS